MLSNTEKKEMIEDGKSKKRQKEFYKSYRKINDKKKDSKLDDYINFLHQIQKIFGPFKYSAQKKQAK